MPKAEGDPGERISDAEHAVMEALWRKNPRTATEVCDEVCDEKGWSLATVKTLLSRLVAKQAIEARPDGMVRIHFKHRAGASFTDVSPRALGRTRSPASLQSRPYYGVLANQHALRPRILPPYHDPPPRQLVKAATRSVAVHPAACRAVPLRPW